MSRKRKYSDEFRLNVVQEYLSGKHGGFRVIAKEHGIDRGELRRWVMHGKMNLPSCGKEFFLQPVSRFFFVR